MKRETELEFPKAQAYFFGVADRTFHYVRAVGRGTFSGSGFRSPMDLALARDGTVYVVNRSWAYRPDGVRITMLTLDEDYVGEFSQFGERDGDLIWPTSVALDTDQNVYIADDWLNRISIFDKDGAFLGKWGVAGSGDGELNKPAGIRFDVDDNLYVVDSGNHRVQKFTKEGKLLLKWGEAGAGEGQFDLPWGLTTDQQGNVYVADWRNDRIQKFDPDGRFLAAFGESGTGVGQFNRPTGLAVDKDGDIYVADWANNRVQVLTAEGRHITTFDGDGDLSNWAKDFLWASPDMVKQMNLVRDHSEMRAFWRPKAIAVDDTGRIIVLDSNRTRFQIYQKDNY